MKATNKATVWYNPQVFEQNNWQVPTTWDEMIALSDEIVAAGGTPANPWSMGMEAAQASGFPGTDWIAQIFLSKYGGEAYDQWVAHEIPWTDPRIKDAWEMFGAIATTEGYVAEGRRRYCPRTSRMPPICRSRTRRKQRCITKGTLCRDS